MLVASGSSQLVWSRNWARRCSSVDWPQSQPLVLNHWQLHRLGPDELKIAVRSAHVAWLAGTIVSSPGSIGPAALLSMEAHGSVDHGRSASVIAREGGAVTHVNGAHEISPTARALLALEAIQNTPGITAQRLGDRLGVTERAARRYVAILREAGLPVESVTGPYGGYQIGRGMRLPPLTFSAAEAAGLVMAVLEGHRAAADPADLVGGALAKIIRVLPARVSALVRPIRDVTATAGASGDADDASARPRVSPELTTALFEACAAGRRLRLAYRLAGRGEDRGEDRGERAERAEREMEVDPWAVILRRSRWYLLCWSHTRDARRVLRVDQIGRAHV